MQMRTKQFVMITAVLAGVIALSLGTVVLKRMAKNPECKSKLHTLGIQVAVLIKNGQKLSDTWCDQMLDAGISKEALACFDGNRKITSSFALNRNLINKNAVPPNMVVLFESRPGWNLAGGPELLNTDHHAGRGCYVLFGNSEVRFVRAKEFDKLIWSE